jgi:bifunctional NMN adenylyltransferase/nudix hydrolase
MTASTMTAPTSNRDFSYLCFIGRFQPLHNGHVDVIQRALAIADKVVLLIGSANTARSPYNPFTYEERCEMIKASIASGVFSANRDGQSPDQIARRIIMRPLADFPYNEDAWIAQAQRTIHRACLDDVNPSPSVTLHGLNDFKIGLIGYSKDHTSFYLKRFPDFRSVSVEAQYGTLSATGIRNDYLKPTPRIPETYVTPAAVGAFMAKFMLTDTFKWLVAEHQFCTGYRNSWSMAPFPPTIMCADTVVVQSGHVLLINRNEHPGKGLLALPGGHIGQNERVEVGAIRELREETAISDDKGEIPPGMLASFIDRSKTRLFDDPNRSQRGRVLTQAYLLNLPQRTKLFTVTARDDAADVRWYPIGELDCRLMHDDHAAIITEMTGTPVLPRGLNLA